jgi:simple sugar transport system permease protein
MRFERRLDTPRWLVVVVPIASVAVAVVLSGLVLLATQHDPFHTFSRLVERGFTGHDALSQTLISSTPLLFTGLAAAVAFRMQVWNIGGEGQLYMGAICSSWAALVLHDRGGAVMITAMVVAGLVGGMAWGIIPGLLRARFSTNEIITSLMLNYVAGLLLTYLIFDSRSYWRDTTSFSGKTFPQGKPLPGPSSWPSLLAGINPAADLLVVLLVVGAWTAFRRRRHGGALLASRPMAVAYGIAVLAVVGWLLTAPNLIIRVPFGFFLGAAVAAGLWVLFRATRYGFEVRVIGDSPAAAGYAGMRTRRKIVSIMALSGAVAGLGGASQMGDFRHVLDARGLRQSGYGYTGIVVAALARYNPFSVILVSVLLGGVSNAGYSLQGPDFPAGLVGVVQGMILFCALGGELLVHHRFRIGGTPDVDETPPEAGVTPLLTEVGA